MVMKRKAELNALRSYRQSVLVLCLSGLTLLFTTLSLRAEPVSQDDQVLLAARQVVMATAFPTLITVDAIGQPKARTVDAFAPDADWVVWVATRPNTRKVAEIRKTPRVTLHYFSETLKSYVSLMGEATLVSDLATKRALRRDQDSAKLYPNFPDDYQLIRIQPTHLEGILPGFRGDPSTWAPVGIDFP